MSLPEKQITKYLQPQILTSISNLELIAKLVVEGFITGLHKSPFHGFSVEFSQHKAYNPGDSLRYIDWKVLGRTDRYYIKQFEEETNVRAYILMDISKSMLFGSGAVSKAQYSSYLAAALFYMLIRQRDAVGLALFDENVQKNLTPKSVFSYLDLLLREIDQARYGADTHIANAIHTLAEQIRRRSLIILISDLLDDPDEIISGLKHFRHDQHEVLVFHVIDKKEVIFDFDGEIIFEDLESGDRLRTHPGFIREDYIQQYQKYLSDLAAKMRNNRIEYQQLYTDTPLDIALSQFISKRKKML